MWGRSILGLHLSSAAFWGAAACLSTVYLTMQDRSMLIILLAHASMGLGMLNLLVHDLRHMNVAVAVLYGPLLFVEVVFVDGWWQGPALITLAYLVYLILQGRKLGMAYWQQVTDNYDLSVIARRDFLTHLPNRLGMEEALDHAVNTARQGGRLMALLYIDLDGFKEVNDRYSHRTGDLLLREVARRLSSGVAPAGVAARLGGDEFAVLVADCPSQETASRIADSILQATKAPVLIDGHAVVCSASVGVSFFPDDADTADHLVRAADRAMYIAKNSGKDRVCILQNLPTGDIFAIA